MVRPPIGEIAPFVKIFEPDRLPDRDPRDCSDSEDPRRALPRRGIAKGTPSPSVPLPSEWPRKTTVSQDISLELGSVVEVKSELPDLPDPES